MILTIDIGNSNIVCVLYDRSFNHLYDVRLDTIKKDSCENYLSCVHSICEPILKKFEVDDFIMSCVVPSITDAMFEVFKQKLNCKGHLLSMQDVPEFIVQLDQPNELGADLIATSFGAFRKFKQPTIIIDMGSATKITVIDEKGEFASGLLLPGLKVAQNAMNAFIPHLPQIPLEMPQRLLGRDTISCMQAGLMYSTIDSIRGICLRIEEELNQTCIKVLTGGLSNIVKSALSDYEFEPFLLNEGLLQIYLKKHL